MAIRNAKLGGPDFTNGEVLYDYDLDDTFNAVQYEQKVINNTSVNISVNGTVVPSDSANITVFVPANSVQRYINIQTLVRASARALDTNDNRADCFITVRISKTYNTIETNLLPLSRFVEAETDISSGNDRENGERDRNWWSSNLYYQPTNDEKINGFEVTVYIEGTASSQGGFSTASGSIDYLNIMGL